MCEKCFMLTTDPEFFIKRYLTKDDFFYKKEKQFLISRALLSMKKKLCYNDLNFRVLEEMIFDTHLVLTNKLKNYINILSHVFHLN